LKTAALTMTQIWHPVAVGAMWKKRRTIMQRLDMAGALP
jgi:hypothetical protein